MKPTSNQRPLPFPEWVEQTYPQKTATVKFLRAIGALDLAYLMYVMKSEKQQKNQKNLITPHVIPAMPLTVEELRTEKEEVKPETIEYKTKKKATKPKKEKPAAAKKEPKKTAKPKHVSKKKTEKTDELTIEFEHKPEPAAAHKPIETEQEPIEPEPLILHEEPVVEEVTPADNVWIDDESLEDADLRKTSLSLKTGSTSISFDVTDVDDEEETRLIVNGTTWRAMLPSPALNLSRMAQIVRVSYGELYVLGRMALGAMSGECYITAEEAARIVTALAACTDKTTEMDITCFDKNRTSKSRKASSVRIRFERC